MSASGLVIRVGRKLVVPDFQVGACMVARVSVVM
jgi:hypothetical protein